MTNPIAQDLGGVVLDGVRFEIVKVACRDEPGACGLRIHIDHQSFDIGRGFDDSEHAEWMAKQFSSALNRLVARTHSAEIAGALEQLRDLHDSIRTVYDAVPALPITADTVGAATDALHAFCLLVGIHRVDVGDPQPQPAMQQGGGGGE